MLTHLPSGKVVTVKKGDSEAIIAYSGKSEISHLSSEMLRIKIAFGEFPNELYTLMCNFAEKNKYKYSMRLHIELMSGIK